ncbi:Gfo/Idh/MocA family oxidoreductase [Microbacterium sp. C5A9]|uniref:Gfo/Idh/MocA family protein n=1 Tax=Microbacterium sp. C5A9 TaxID=2736663 RepID=UPI001F51987E|nr:Gfo/Idh/MocA family oxidoreductase [Microbacterium sp. C5A9]MCI1020451.1 Gfo/Idh/MocA family oxidoreductase [Microbacterium sp. C5A9]
MAYRVGVLGAGPGVSALHLPTLDRLPDLFRVVHIADGGSGRAEALARRAGARWSTGTAELLADPEVDVVAICSPPERHAEQILDAVAAGARTILCEKPLALTHDEADAVVDACRDAGVALVVGTNHLFDPAWGRARHHIAAEQAPVRAISITVSLPPNGRYHDVVTESLPGAVPARPAPDWRDAGFSAAVVRQLVLGLGVHDLPLLRDLAPRLDRVVFARPLAPIGYCIGFIAGDVLLRLSAVMLPAGADALWRLTVATGRDLVDVEFPPAFVHDGSARARVRHVDGRVSEYPPLPDDGYVAEWRVVAALAGGVEAVEYDEMLADAHYAIDLADAAALAVREGMTR